VDANGEVTCNPPDDSAWHAFTAWKLAKACLHQGMILVRHRLGNESSIEQIRAELAKQARTIPILLNQVVYSGTHTCDWLPLQALPALTEELKNLEPGPSQNSSADTLRIFKIQMAELVIAAQLAHKPICF
jgi:hypothetical protein